MSNPELKKETEGAAFRNFLRLSGKTFDHFESGKEPEPDIIGWQGENQFGIEITSYHREPEKWREGEEDKVITTAQRYYEQQGQPCINVQVSWAPYFKMTKKNREHLAKKLVQLVQANVPPLKSWVELDWNSFDEEMMCALNYVTINRIVDYTRNHWHATRARFIPNWQQTILQEKLDRKKDKPAGYNRKYVETWLLIESAFGSPSAWLEFTDEVRNATYQSPYGRAFLLSSFPHEVIELNLRP